MLFFQAFKDHDYYTINLFILIPLVILGFLLLLKDVLPKVYASVFLKIFLIAFLIHNVDFSRRRMESRYSPEGWENRNYTEYVRPYGELKPYLHSIGIKDNDRVICLSDNSINITLYFMNQEGWTNYGILADSVRIREKIGLGAKFLLIHDKKTIEENSIQPFVKNKIGQFRNIEIFRL